MNFQEFQDIMEPILAGIPDKMPTALEPPTIDDIIKDWGEAGIDKEIDKLKEKWEQNENAKEKPVPTIKEQRKPVKKDTVFKMYTEPGNNGSATSDSADAAQKWNKYRQSHPKSKEKMRTFNQKTKITTSG